MCLLGNDAISGCEVWIPRHPRPHTCMVGASGMGKTQTIAGMAISDIADGAGVAVWDNHGDLVRQIIANLPSARVEDTVFLDLTDVHRYAPPINLYACPDPTNPAEVAKVSSFVLHLLELIWGTGLQTAPLMSMVMRNLSYVLIEHGLTLCEAGLLLSDDATRERLTATLKNPQAKRFWEEYEAMSPRDRRDLVSSAQNKIDALLSPLMAPILSQTTTLPWRRFLDEGRILLIQGNPLVSEASRLISALLLGQLLLSSFSRIIDTPEELRRPYFVSIDEAQAVATKDMAVWLHEARKAAISLCLASQSLSEYDELMRAAVLSAGTLLVYRVSGEEAKTFATSFDHTPPLEQTGVEPVRAPVSDVVGHLVRRGHTHPVIARFTTDYLMPLEAFLKKVGPYQHEFAFGYTVIYKSHLIDGQRLLNDCLSECMRTGRADSFIPPLALLTLGGAADYRSTHVFYDHIRSSIADNYVLKGFYQSANTFGRPGFRTEQALERFLASYTRPGWLRRLFGLSRTVPDSITAFVHMLRSLRQVMEILATEPILVDTGQYTPVFRPRPYQDVENQIANEISQLERFTCRVKLLTSEHTVKTLPAPRGLTGPALEARIAAIKERMIEEQLLLPVQEVLKQVEERHERLRAPASKRSGSGRPPRPSEPPTHD